MIGRDDAVGDVVEHAAWNGPFELVSGNDKGPKERQELDPRVLRQPSEGFIDPLRPQNCDQAKGIDQKRGLVKQLIESHNAGCIAPGIVVLTYASLGSSIARSANERHEEETRDWRICRESGQCGTAMQGEKATI